MAGAWMKIEPVLVHLMYIALVVIMGESSLISSSSPGV